MFQLRVSGLRDDQDDHDDHAGDHVGDLDSKNIQWNLSSIVLLTVVIDFQPLVFRCCFFVTS